MTFLKRLYGMIISPRKTLDDITARPSLMQGITVIVGIQLLNVLFVYNKRYIMSILGTGMTPYDMSNIMALIPMFISIGIFGAMFITPVFHFISTAVYHLLARFLGHEGNPKGLFTGLAYSNIPGIFSTIVYAILLALRMEILSFVFTLGVAAWVIVLKIFAIKRNYKMGGGKATLIYFIPIITITVLIGIMLVLAFVTMIPIISKQI